MKCEMRKAKSVPGVFYGRRAVGSRYNLQDKFIDIERFHISILKFILCQPPNYEVGQVQISL